MNLIGRFDLQLFPRANRARSARKPAAARPGGLFSAMLRVAEQSRGGSELPLCRDGSRLAGDSTARFDSGGGRCDALGGRFEFG